MRISASYTGWFHPRGPRPELPPGEAYIVNTNKELADATGSSSGTPPTQQDVFNQWTRFSNNDTYLAGTAPEGSEAASWEYAESFGGVQTTVNSATVIGFVSPDTFSYIEIDLLLLSTSNDDDNNYVVIAFTSNNGVNRSLVITRGQHGNIGLGWAIQMLEGGTFTTLVDGSDSTDAASYKNSNPAGTNGGWTQSGPTRIYVRRVGNTIEAITSQFKGQGTSDTNKANYVLDTSTRLTYTIPADSPFAQPCAYGYASYSQARSSFRSIVIKGGLDASVVYRVNSESSVTVYEYNAATSAWQVNANRNIWAELDYPRNITNPETRKTYRLNGSDPYSVKLVS